MTKTNALHAVLLFLLAAAFMYPYPWKGGMNEFGGRKRFRNRIKQNLLLAGHQVPLPPKFGYAAGDEARRPRN